MGYLRSDYSQDRPWAVEGHCGAFTRSSIEGGIVMALADGGALKGKVAVITGAATGIGRASALLFARAGARVMLADSREPELARTEADVRAAGGGAASIVAELARPDSCAAVVEAALRAFGRLDVVLRSEEHTSELQSRPHLVCRLLLEKKKQ